LFRLLRTLGTDTQFGLSLPWCPPDIPGTLMTPDKLTSIVVRPRFTFGQHVILSRRTWNVPSSLFPRLAANESAAEHFARVQRWRFDAGIPDRAYVRIFGVKKKDEQAATAPESGEEAMVGETEATPDDEAPAADHTARATPADTTTPARKPQVSPDAGKPQFIDFTNPLFVDLFSRLPGELVSFLACIEEVLPDTEDYPRHGEDTHCTEFVVQLDLDP
jgi:lantibiotic biosynthesis protein